MNKSLRWRSLLVVGIAILAVINFLPLNQKINLGLDLQGGMHLVLKVDTSKIPQDARRDAPERALEIIRNRIDQLGVKETSVLLQGNDEIVVQLPGVTDRQRALDIIGKTALLEFKLVVDNPDLFNKAISGETPEGYELLESNKEKFLVKKEPELTGDAIQDASVKFDQSHFNEPIVGISFNIEGAKKFAKITQDNVGKRLAIVLDGKLQSAPRINEPIPSGEAVITGRFSPEEAQDLAIVLRVGALPAPVYIEEERTVGPLLGRDSIAAGVKSTIIGGIVVVAMMALYYLFAGLISNVALLLNFVLILGALGYFHATLTLPGIAGIVLTLGMAVDANVLINERIREELALGRPLKAAIANGYSRAFSAILDSNVTTLIAAFLLFQFGTGPIRGFAVTLSIGLVASLFTSIFVTRVIFDWLSNTKILANLKMLRLFGATKIDFIGKRKMFFVLSIVVVAIGMMIFFSKGNKAYGIDFTGGEFQQYRFKTRVSTEKIRTSLNALNMPDVGIQEFGKNNEVIIKTHGEHSTDIEETLKKDFPDNAQLTRVEKVGPSVGSQLRHKAVMALLWAIVGIAAYIWIRFKSVSYGVAGVVALFHDVFLAVGAMAITGRQIDLTIVAALLTIAGYSINDTIVIYDRIRELLRTTKKVSFADVINLAVNQTLARTILTSVTTIAVVICLFLFGGEVLNNFAFCLLVGFVSGVYSTVYIASPLLLAWHRRA
jgi:SecD/SecF fusion protein